MSDWNPRNLIILLVVSTACLCLIILVLGTVWGVLTGIITAELLGTIGGMGVGAGLLGFGMIIYLILRISIPKEVKQ